VRQGRGVGADGDDGEALIKATTTEAAYVD
jgi:hypothetical protein